jgi:predicted methyltransferase
MMERIRRQILQALFREPMSVYRLIDEQDASLPEFFELLQQMENEGLIEVADGKVSLTDKGVELCESLGLKKIDRFSCSCCEGTGYEINDFFKEVMKEYSKIAEERPEAIEKFDQGFISIDGVIRRVEFIYERGDLLKTKIFVVGDDDLFSIASALTGLPEKVFVIDIDERLIDFINKKADEYGLPVEATVYDVQQAFPDELKRKFDVFVTDPVETIPGLKLFLSRGVSTLKGVGCSGYFGLTTLEASRKKWLEIQKMIHEMGFVITDMRRKFNVYPQDEKNFFRFQEKLPIVKKLGARIDYNWYKSTLYRIEAVQEPKPLVEGEMIIDEKVYKDDESWATPY